MSAPVACNPLLMSRIHVREQGRHGRVLCPVCVGLRGRVKFYDPRVGEGWDGGEHLKRNVHCLILFLASFQVFDSYD